MEEPEQQVLMGISVDERNKFQIAYEDKLLGHELDESIAAGALILPRRVGRRR